MTNFIRSLHIEKIVTGGYGLGRSENGKIILVHNVLPGEIVDVQIFRSKKSYDLGFVTSISTPSDQRINPSCPYFNKCGGCTFQHLSYKDQIHYKQDIFLEDWQRFCQETNQHAKVEFLRASQPFAYRQRIRLHVVDAEVCFYRYHSTKPIVVEQCLLARYPINKCLQRLDDMQVWQDLLDHVSEIVLHHNPENDRCLLELFVTRKLRPTDEKRINSLLDLDLVQGIRVYGQSRELLLSVGDDSDIRFSMTNEYGTSSFVLIPGDFCQINMEQNQAMLDFVMNHIDHGQPCRILDLFCGLGNFAIPLARQGHRVTGIDLKRSSIRSAERNNLLNETGADFIRMSAEDGVQEEINQGNKYDIIILDPPRAGFKEGASDLHQLAAEKIFYISCDQQTQMRDLRQIVSRGYRVKEVCLVDMFPQTHHLESLVVLEREET